MVLEPVFELPDFDPVLLVVPVLLPPVEPPLPPLPDVVVYPLLTEPPLPPAPVLPELPELAVPVQFALPSTATA